MGKPQGRRRLNVCVLGLRSKAGATEVKCYVLGFRLFGKGTSGNFGGHGRVQISPNTILWLSSCSTYVAYGWLFEFLTA